MVTPLIAKVGGVWILFVMTALLSYYAGKRKMRPNFAKGMALLLALVVVGAAYRFSPYIYLSETKQLVEFLFSNLPALVVLFAFFPLFAFSAYRLSSRVSPQTYRSLYHVLVLSFLGMIFWLNPDLGFLSLSFVIISMVFSEAIRITHPAPSSSPPLRELLPLLKDLKVTEFLVHLVHRGIGSATRKGEIKLYTAGVFGLLGILLAVLGFSKQVAVASIFILAFADPTAALLGRKVGTYCWSHNPPKSLEGSLGAFMVTLVIVCCFGFNPLWALVVAGSVMIFESLPLLMSDNLVLPLMAGILLTVAP